MALETTLKPLVKAITDLLTDMLEERQEDRRQAEIAVAVLRAKSGEAEGKPSDDEEDNSLSSPSDDEEDNSLYRRGQINEAQLSPLSLLRSYFNITDGWPAFRPISQGQVVGEIQPGVYLCHLFSWEDGSDACQRVYPVSQMGDWHFFDSAENMNAALSDDKMTNVEKDTSLA